VIDRHLSTSLAIVLMRASIMACKFGMALFIGRYLDLAALGLYGLAAGAIALGPVVIGLGLVHLIMRDAVTMPAIQLADVLRHYWCFTIAIYAVLIAITVLLTLALGLSELWLVIALIMLFEHLGSDVFQLQSNLEQPLQANANAFIRGAAWVLAYVPLSIYAPGLRSLSVLFAFWLAGSVVALLLFAWTSRAWPWRAAFSLPLRSSWLPTTIRPALLIYVSDLSFAASQYIDRYLVTLFLGLRLAGIYFLCWSFANAASTFVSMTTLQVQRPLLIRAYHAGGAPLHRQFAARLARNAALSSIAFGTFIGVVFHMLLPLLDQPLVAAYIPAFWLIVAGMALRNMADFGAMALFTARRDGLMTLTNVVAVVMLVLAQALLLPMAGLYGAGAAILITFVAVTLWRFAIVFSRPSAGMRPQQANA
jgi:O-antigen/teichoic acid export membrane protein